MVSGMNRGGLFLCGILLKGMDKIRFSSENREGRKIGIVRSVGVSRFVCLRVTTFSEKDIL